MMCPDHGAVDHVGRAIPLYHLGECLEECVEHAHLHPAPIAPEHAVPLAPGLRRGRPYSSGRCRPCDPVRAIHSMPSKQRRLSCERRHPRLRSAGSSGPMAVGARKKAVPGGDFARDRLIKQGGFVLPVRLSRGS
jgi:hypothetical protein